MGGSNSVIANEASHTSTDGGIKEKAFTIWHSALSNQLSCAELIDHVADSIGIHRSQVAGWAQIHGWTAPRTMTHQALDESDILDDSIDATDTRTGNDCSTYLANLTFLDETRRDLRDSACDPLQDWLDRLQSGDEQRRKQINAYMSAAGYNHAVSVDLDEMRDLTRRYPLTYEQIAMIYSCEASPLKAYMTANDVSPHPYADISTVSVPFMIMNDPGITKIAIRQAQKLHRERAVPINKIARRIHNNHSRNRNPHKNKTLPWRDMWALGCQFGVWHMPDPKTIADIESDVIHHRLAT